jgi:hypothetical protein
LKGRRPGRALVAAALCLSPVGCLDDAPTFAPRGQIPPFVFSSRVLPPMGSVYEGPIPFPINVPFQSEDVNIDLEARIYLDLVPGAATGEVALSSILAAGVYEDESRSVKMDWVEPLRGCHSLTLILTSTTNFDDASISDAEPTRLPIDESRAARVVWLLNIGDIDDTALIDSCPAASQEDLE